MNYFLCNVLYWIVVVEILFCNCSNCFSNQENPNKSVVQVPVEKLDSRRPNRLFRDLFHSDLFEVKIEGQPIRYGQTILVDGMLKKEAVNNSYIEQFRYQFYGYRIVCSGRPDLLLKFGPHVFNFSKDRYTGRKIPFDQWIRLKCKVTDASSGPQSGKYLVQVEGFQQIDKADLPKYPTHPKTINGVLLDKDGIKFLKTENGLFELISPSGPMNDRVSVEVFGELGGWKQDENLSRKWKGSVGAKLKLDGMVFADSNRYSVRRMSYLQIDSLLGKEVVFYVGETDLPKRIAIGNRLLLALVGEFTGNVDLERKTGPCIVSGTLVKTDPPEWDGDYSSQKDSWFSLKEADFLFSPKRETKTHTGKKKRRWPIYDSPNHFSDGVLDLRNQYHYINNPTFPPAIYGYLNSNRQLIRYLIERDSLHTRSVLRRRLKDPGRSFEVKLIIAGLLASWQDTAGEEFLLSQLKEKKERSEDVFLIVSGLERFRKLKKPKEARKPQASRLQTKQRASKPVEEADSNTKGMIERIFAVDPNVQQGRSVPKIESWVVRDLKEILFRHPDILDHPSEFLLLNEKGLPIQLDEIPNESVSNQEIQVAHLYNSDLLKALVDSKDPEVTDFLISILDKVFKRLEFELERVNVKDLKATEDWYGYPLGRLTRKALDALARSSDPKAVSVVNKFAMMELEDVSFFDEFLIPYLAKNDINGLVQLFICRLMFSNNELYVDYLAVVGKEKVIEALKKRFKEFDSETRPYAEFLIQWWEGSTLEDLLESERTVVRFLAARELSKRRSETTASMFSKKLQQWEPDDFVDNRRRLYELLSISIDNCISSNRPASIGRLVGLMEIRWRYFGLPNSGREIRLQILRKLVALSGKNFPYDQQLWKKWFQRKYPKRSKVPN